MKKVSTAALALTMMSGAAIVVALPAAAKKKEEAPTGPQISPAFGAALNKAKAAGTANNDAAFEAATVEAEGLAKTDDEKYYASYLRYLLTSQRVSQASQGTNGVFNAAPLVPSLDAMIANPKTPADMRPKVEYTRATIAYDQKNYPLAIQLFTRAQADGSTEPNLSLYLLKAKILGGDSASGLAELDSYYTAGKPMTEELFRFAIGRANDAKLRGETVKWLQRWVSAMPTAKNWHDVLAFYGYSQKPVATLDKFQLIDLFRLMRQTGALADQNSYEAFAQRLALSGLPEETKAVVDEGRVKGRLPAGSPAIALGANAAAQITTPAALASLTTKSGASADGKMSQQTADVYLGRGDYAQAITLYRQALAKGGVDADRVNTDLGIALALSGDKAGAKTVFELVKTTPRSEIAGFWLVWLDHPAAN